MNVSVPAHAKRRVHIALVLLAFAALTAITVTPASADAAVGQELPELTLGLTGASSTAFEDEMAVEARFDAGLLADDSGDSTVDVTEIVTSGGIPLVSEPERKVAAKTAPEPAAPKPAAPAKPKATTKAPVRSSVPVVYADSDRKWSTSHLDSVCRAALAAYGVPKAEWDWVLATNRNIAYRESGNRPGARSGGGEYAGLHQWSSDWGKLENRLDGEWSVYRFVKVYDEGGKSKIRQHWSSTVGL